MLFWDLGFGFGFSVYWISVSIYLSISLSFFFFNFWKEGWFSADIVQHELDRLTLPLDLKPRVVWVGNVSGEEKSNLFTSPGA